MCVLGDIHVLTGVLQVDTVVVPSTAQTRTSIQEEGALCYSCPDLHQVLRPGVMDLFVNMWTGYVCVCFCSPW